MDSITFEIGDVTIQMVNNRVLIWNGMQDKEADVDLPLDILRNALQTASMLRRDKK